MYSNSINTHTPIKEEYFKPNMDSQNFNFDGEAFSDLMDKEEASGGGLRETAKELAEDEAILSTDEENRAMIKKRQNPTEFQKVVPAGQEDKTRLLQLMDMSNKINMSAINISKSKKELENTVGVSIDEPDEPEDITSVISKMMASKEPDSEPLEADVQSSLDLEKHLQEFQDKKNNSQVLHETDEELAEDEAILSTEEENLAIARRNMEAQRLSDDEYKTTEDDMMFLNDMVAKNNQAFLQNSSQKQSTENILSALMSQTMNVTNYNKIDISEMKKADVDCLIGMLRRGVQNPTCFVADDNDELDFLSKKFLALLKDTIVNNKVLRIDFDKDISVIIRINKEGQLSLELQTTDEEMAKHIKENLYILRQKFDELNVKYDEISLKQMK